MNTPKLSIVIPTYNRVSLLKEAINSFADKLRCSYEVIIVDDGSTDGTAEFLQTLHAPFQVVIADHCGPAAARNTALSHVTGCYINFLDDDDLLDPDCMAAQIAYLDSHPDITMCYSDWGYVARTASGHDRRWLYRMEDIQDAIDAMIIDWWCPPFAYLFRTEHLRGLAWDTSLTTLTDFGFVSDVALTGAKFGHVRTGSDSVGWYRAILDNAVRVSKRSNFTRTQAELQVLGKIKRTLETKSVLTESRKQLLAARYFGVARRIFPEDRALFRDLIKQVLDLDPAFMPEGPRYQRLIQLFGFERAEWLRRARLSVLAKRRSLLMSLKGLAVRRPSALPDNDALRTTIVHSHGPTVLPRI
ncbi:MAG TPA: glycosyltransferase family 2 protein [Aggregatilineales bacterium]|nr:glycosyltransferase family 2 protein [Aggregatilineales bacterium]